MNRRKFIKQSPVAAGIAVIVGKEVLNPKSVKASDELPDYPYDTFAGIPVPIIEPSEERTPRCACISSPGLIALYGKHSSSPKKFAWVSTPPKVPCGKGKFYVGWESRLRMPGSPTYVNGAVTLIDPTGVDSGNYNHYSTDLSKGFSFQGLEGITQMKEIITFNPSFQAIYEDRSQVFLTSNILDESKRIRMMAAQLDPLTRRIQIATSNPLEDSSGDDGFEIITLAEKRGDKSITYTFPENPSFSQIEEPIEENYIFVDGKRFYMTDGPNRKEISDSRRPIPPTPVD